MPDNIIPLRPDRTAQDRSPPEPTYTSDNIRGVAPIPAEHLRAIFNPKPDLCDGFSDDSECTDELSPRIGPFSIAVMLLIAFVIGVWLALGHS